MQKVVGGDALVEYTRRVEAVARLEEAVKEEEAVVMRLEREEKVVKDEVEVFRARMAGLHEQAKQAVARMLSADPKLSASGVRRSKDSDKNCSKLSDQLDATSSDSVAGGEKGWEGEGGGRYRMDQRNHLGEGMDENALYAERFSSAEHPVLTRVREQTLELLPGRAHMLSGVVQGQLLGMLASMVRARRVLDVGCFTGYSALSTAAALDDDAVIYTVERDEDTAALAQENFERSPWAHKIHLVRADGIQLLTELAGVLGGGGEGEGLPAGMADGPFDMVYLDANKKQYQNYFRLIFDSEILRVGGVLVVDNVLWKGKVPEFFGLTPEERVSRNQALESKGVRSLVEADKYADAMHQFNILARSHPRAQVVMLPLRDGLSIIRRVE
jgi:predicted O-methyltransferase YrrM